MKNNQKENEQFYIVSLDNGIREEEPVTMTVFNSFKDGSELVQLNNNVFGVYKNNSNSPETAYIDDYDIIKSDIAELLDVDHEESKRMVTDKKVAGIFTLLNYSKDIETRISATTVLNHIVEYVKNGTITGDDAEWVTKVLKYQGTKGNPIKEEAKVDDIINIGIYSLIKEIEVQKGIPLDDKGKDAIYKSYFRMIILDYLTGRRYRGLDYNLISKMNEQGKPEWTDAYFGPISISNSVDKDSYVNKDEYVLNNIIVDKNVVLECLFKNHYKEIKKMTEALNDAKKLYTDAISRIIYNNTNLEKAQSLEKEILANLDKLTKRQEELEKKADKEHKINKVERTIATQSLNVRVTTKLDLIQKKYPINPKDHPELIDEAIKKRTKEEQLKLIVEEERKNKSGHMAASVLIALVGLIVGIGIGVTYILLMFGD